MTHFYIILPCLIFSLPCLITGGYIYIYNNNIYIIYISHRITHLPHVRHFGCLKCLYTLRRAWSQLVNHSIILIYPTWWLIPLSKWVITPVINGKSRVNPLITGVITHLLSGMSHQVLIKNSYYPFCCTCLYIQIHFFAGEIAPSVKYCRTFQNPTVDLHPPVFPIQIEFNKLAIESPASHAWS